MLDNDPDFYADPFGGKGSLLVNRPDKRVWICEVEPGKFSTCEVLRTDPVLEANKVAFNENAGKRWGDGQVAASIPLPIYFRELAPAKKAGDEKYISKWLNDADHRAFRTFKGRV